MRTNDLGNIGNSRTAEQLVHMRETIGQGVCPFCDLDKKMNEVIREGKHWRAWFNPFPYPFHRAHLVLASVEHWTSLQEVPPEAWAEWGVLNAELVRTFNLAGGGMVMRFGDNSYNGGTLSHVHSHIQVPDKTGFAIAVFYKDERLSQLLGSPK